MSKKYTIRLEREEFYEIVVDVVAESEAEAVTEVERRHDDGEFWNRMNKDGPYDSSEHIYCVSESEVLG